MVSTANVALQDQIFSKDLPAAQNYPRPAVYGSLWARRYVSA